MHLLYTTSQTLKSLWTLLIISFTVHTDFCTVLFFNHSNPPKSSFLKASCHQKKYSTMSQPLSETNSLSRVPQMSNITQIPHSCQILLCLPWKLLNIPQCLRELTTGLKGTWQHSLEIRGLRNKWSSLCAYFANQKWYLRSQS